MAPWRVVIIGGGVVGTNAAKMAAGLGAHVTVLDVSLERLRYLSDVMPANVQLVHSNRYVIREHIQSADLVIGAVLVVGAKAPRLIRRDTTFTGPDRATARKIAISSQPIGLRSRKSR